MFVLCVKTIDAKSSIFTFPQQVGIYGEAFVISEEAWVVLTKMQDQLWIFFVSFGQGSRKCAMFETIKFKNFHGPIQFKAIVLEQDSLSGLTREHCYKNF